MADENLNVLGMQTVTEDAFNSLDVEHKDSYNTDNSDNSVDADVDVDLADNSDNSTNVDIDDSGNDNSDNSDNSTNVAVADSGNSDSSTNVARFWTCQLSPSPPRRRG